MHSDSHTLHQEIKKISNLQSLLIARYFLLFSCSVVFIYYFAHRYGLYCLYIVLFELVAPGTLNHALPDKKTDSDNVILPTLKKSYAYDSKKYLCLLITFWLSNILLITWQISTVLHPTAYFFANFFPCFALSGHILIFFVLSCYYKMKLHSQLINNRW